MGIEVIESWQGDAFYHYNGVVMGGKDEMKCARTTDGKECGGDIYYISPRHLQCEKCLVVHKIEEKSDAD